MGKLQEGYNTTVENGTLDLKEWTKQWLVTKGPNKLFCEFTEEGGVIKTF